MESSEGNNFVDHKEIVISVPKPRLLNALKVDIAPPEDVHSSEAGGDPAHSELQVSVSETGATSSEQEPVSEDTASSFEGKSVVTQESSSSKNEVVSSTKTVKMFATTVYTQRISGKRSRSSDSDGDMSSPTKETTKASFPASPAPAEVRSPTEICSVQFNVAAGVAPSTTTAYSKMFTKTVETTTEVQSKERHLSECSISIGGHADRLPSQETGSGSPPAAKEDTGHETENQEVNDDGVFAEVFTTVKSEDEKEAAEYSPGLAIRTLTLEDLQEKRPTPERDTDLSKSPIQVTDMSVAQLASVSSSLTQEKGMFSFPTADAVGGDMSMPVPVSKEGVLSSEYNTSQLSASESPASITVSNQASSLTSGGQVLMQCTEEPATLHRKPFFNPIEVERKFTMKENTEEELRSLGARLHKEKTFTDVYYDSEEFALIVTDCWLRRRNDSWEAKVPLKTQDVEAIFSPASQYKEINGEREISTWLVDHLGLETWMRGDPIDLLIQAAGLVEFARFTTTRRTYTLPSCMVDLDLTDNGFQVGEIDVMAASPEELPQALQTISHVAEQLDEKNRIGPLGQSILHLIFALHVSSTVMKSATSCSVT